jgi:large subunit ribosomal protein L16
MEQGVQICLTSCVRPTIPTIVIKLLRENSYFTSRLSMLSPKRTKYRKPHRGRRTGRASTGHRVAFGEFGLQAAEPAWLTARQLEASRRVLTRYVRRGGKLWIRVFPDKAVTRRAAETRRGSGKGSPEFWVAVVRPGTVVFEILGIPEAAAREARRIASSKRPRKTTFVARG